MSNKKCRCKKRMVDGRWMNDTSSCSIHGCTSNASGGDAIPGFFNWLFSHHANNDGTEYYTIEPKKRR
jgi:hypothetical protein